jgi:hypothetical protein
LTGTIPQSLRWEQLFFLDLGQNLLTGTLPEDFGEQSVALRHLHLDHNRFNGTLPASYLSVGNYQLETLKVDHNQLTGAVPSNHETNIGKELYDAISYFCANNDACSLIFFSQVQYTLHANNFSEDLNKKTCKLSVFDSGDLVEFNADCDICSCDKDFMCARCEDG